MNLKNLKKIGVVLGVVNNILIDEKSRGKFLIYFFSY